MLVGLVGDGGGYGDVFQRQGKVGPVGRGGGGGRAVVVSVAFVVVTLVVATRAGEETSPVESREVAEGVMVGCEEAT